MCFKIYYEANVFYKNALHVMLLTVHTQIELQTQTTEMSRNINSLVNENPPKKIIKKT